MCAIAGIIGIEAEAALRAMLQSMYHRGPDDSGIWSSNGIAIGQNRLSILDLSKQGHQPMNSFCGRYWISFNGEIYNYRQLRKELQASGIEFHSNTDTEVIVNLFSRDGKKCFQRLRGMFAISIWDTQKEELWLARDPLGIKPLLFSQSNGVFVFASELKGILASGLISRKVDYNAITEFLSFGHIIQPNTLFREIKMLMPGVLACYSKSGFLEEKFWDFPKSQNTFIDITYSEAVNEVKNLVLESVEEEMMSDVPIGLFLSGGLDSSVLAAAMKKVSSGKVKSFSLGFEQEGSGMDESNLAKETAKHIGTEHESCIVSSRQVVDDLPHFLSAIDQPSIDGLNSYFVSKFTKDYATVALSGLGGDEVFSGYGWTKQLLNHGEENRALVQAYKKFKNLVPEKIRGYADNLVWKRDFSMAYGTSNSVFQPIEIERYYLPDLDAIQIIGESDFSSSDESRINRILINDCRIFMGSRLLRDSDCVAMASSLEVRFPLIDTRIIEFTMSLPAHYRVSDNFLNSEGVFQNDFNFGDHQVKRLLFDAFKDELPDNFASRKKTGFSMPFDPWMKNELKEFLVDTLSQDLPFMKKGTGLNLYRDFEIGKVAWVQPWAIMVLSKYLQDTKAIL